MAVYQISYDLRKQRNYEALYERIRSYGTWCHPLESTWAIVTTQSVTQVRDYLGQVMDQDDGLLVTSLRKEAAWFGVNTQASNWLKEQLERQAA